MFFCGLRANADSTASKKMRFISFVNLGFHCGVMLRDLVHFADLRRQDLDLLQCVLRQIGRSVTREA